MKRKIEKKYIVLIVIGALFVLPFVFSLAVVFFNFTILGIAGLTGELGNSSTCEGVVIYDDPIVKAKLETLSETEREKWLGANSVKSNYGRKGETVYRIAHEELIGNICIEIEHADSKTFEVIDEYYAKDSNNAYIQKYYLGKHRDPEQYTIFDADTETFEVLQQPFSKDKNNVYNYTSKIPNLDPNTVEFVRDERGHVRFIRDKDTVYTKSDTHSIEATNKQFSSFSKTVNPETFRSIGDYKFADDVYVYDAEGNIIFTVVEPKQQSPQSE